MAEFVVIRCVHCGCPDLLPVETEFDPETLEQAWLCAHCLDRILIPAAS